MSNQQKDFFIPLALKQWGILFLAVVIIIVGLKYSQPQEPSRSSAESALPWSQTTLEIFPDHDRDPLIGVHIVDRRVRTSKYQRLRFGSPWTDDNTAALGHNGCDTRDDILTRDLTHIVVGYRSICYRAVLSGDLFDPYTGKIIHYIRGASTGKSVQIDHIVPLALAWDMGAVHWQEWKRIQFANDPENLLAVSGKANEDKGDKSAGVWQPPNLAFRCQYNEEYAKIIIKYQLAIDIPTANAIRYYVRTCPEVI